MRSCGPEWWRWPINWRETSREVPISQEQTLRTDSGHGHQDGIVLLAQVLMGPEVVAVELERTHRSSSPQPARTSLGHLGWEAQAATVTTPTDDTRRETRTDDVIYAVIILGVLVVAAIAAISSYRHMQGLAQAAGEPVFLSHLFPVSIDGLIVVGSMVLVDRRRRQLPTSGWAWVAVILGVGGSLAANMAGAADNATAMLIAAAAPLAFGICFELLLAQLRSRHADRTRPVLPTPDGLDCVVPPSGAGPTAVHPDRTDTGPGSTERTMATGPAPDRSVARSAAHPAATVKEAASGARGGPPTRTVSADLAGPADRTAAPGEKSSVGPERTGNGPADRGVSSETPGSGPVRLTNEQLLVQLRELADRTDGEVSRNAVVRELGVGATRATKLLKLAQLQPAGEPVLNGAARG